MTYMYIYSSSFIICFKYILLLCDLSFPSMMYFDEKYFLVLME